MTEIVEGSIKYHSPLPYRRHNIRLPFGWSLISHKDAYLYYIALFTKRQIFDLIYWERYNTLYGMAWLVIILGITIKSTIARKACEVKGTRK